MSDRIIIAGLLLIALISILLIQNHLANKIKAKKKLMEVESDNE